MSRTFSRPLLYLDAHFTSLPGRNKLKIIRLVLILALIIIIAPSIIFFSACKPELKPPAVIPSVTTPESTSRSEPSLPKEPENSSSFRFALDYSVEEIVNNHERAASFEREYVRQEAQFFAIARNPASMLTYDGLNLDGESGIPATVRYWSAPSKESLDIAICIKVLTGNKAANYWLRTAML